MAADPRVLDLIVPLLGPDVVMWAMHFWYKPPRDTKHLNYLVIGPWNHGGWSGASGQKLGDVDFGSATSLEFRRTSGQLRVAGCH